MVHACLGADGVAVPNDRTLDARPNLNEVVVADAHRLAAPVDYHRILFDDVVRTDEDGPCDGEDGSLGMHDRP